MRRGMGITSLILGFAAVCVLWFTGPLIHGHTPPRNVMAANVGPVVVWIWLFLSILIKLSMMFNKKFTALNIVSSLMWVLAFCLAVLAGPTGDVFTSLQVASGLFLFTSWLFVDLIDLGLS